MAARQVIVRYDGDGNPVYQSILDDGTLAYEGRVRARRCQREQIDDLRAYLEHAPLWWPENVPCTSRTCRVHRSATSFRLTRARLAVVALGSAFAWLLGRLLLGIGMLLLALLEMPGAPLIFAALLMMLFGPELFEVLFGGTFLDATPSVVDSFQEGVEQGSAAN